MLDRVPKYPGRVRLTPVPGQEDVFDMTRADEATQVGTPLNTATLLKQQTSALFGLGATAVPDDVLAYLGQYNQHWWERTGLIPAKYTLGESKTISWAGSTGTVLIRYSDTVSVSVDGAVSLAEYTEMSSTDIAGTTNNLNTIKGKFFQIGGGGTGIDVAKAQVYLRGNENAGYSQGNASLGLGAGIWTVVQEVIGIAAIPNGTDYVQSSDRNAYPDSGESGGYEYRYLGVPFDNAVTAPNIVTGSYVGTGKYGASNPNSLTFPFAPKLVIFTFAMPSAGGVPSLMYWNDQSMYPVVHMSEYPTTYTRPLAPYEKGNADYGYAKRSEDGKTLYWYIGNSNMHAGNQLNYSGWTYYYIAIG